MKKISSILIVAVVLLASCSKDLNQQPISAATVPTFYKQPNDFIQAVNATYNDLRGYPDRLLNLSETRSDNIYPTNDVARDPDPINNFSAGITANTFVEEAWSTDFNGIFKANTVLDQITKNGRFIGSALLATRLTAEARFLRAFYYFDLVRYYGGLPLINHPVLSAEANTIARSSVTDIDTLIINDLQFAIANLPTNYSGAFPSYTATDVGRATKYAAEATLALVYMTRSGPTYGIAGPGLGLNEWGLALPLLQDIINSGLYTFNPNYASIFSFANQSPTVNKEAIFDVMYVTGQTPVLGATFPWGLAPQNYFNSLPGGNPPTEGTLGFTSVSPNMLSSYDSLLDKRKPQTVHTSPFTYQGVTDAHAFFRKYLDTTKIPASRFDWGINFIAIRYTDVLMEKAECILNGAPGSPSTVDSIINLVRTRAGIPTTSGSTLDTLFAERRKEFADEGSRWFDLQRSGKLVTIMNAWEAVDDAAIHKMNAVVPNYIIYPVPQTQLDAAPGLYKQNPGY